MLCEVFCVFLQSKYAESPLNILMHVRQRIEIKPNNKQKTYFLKCFGLTRLAYNWGLEEWERMYAAKENPKWGEVRAHFNAIKHEDFPFVEEVSSHVTQEAFRNLGKAYKNYRTSIKKKDWMYGKPIKKKRNRSKGSAYFGGVDCKLSDTNKNSTAFETIQHNLKKKRQYLFIPRLGWVKMCERLRYEGKLEHVIVRQHADKFYATFCVDVTTQEYLAHHHPATDKKLAVGIDVGLHHVATLSDGMCIENRPSREDGRALIAKRARQMNHHVHANTKEERKAGMKSSNNFKKAAHRLAKTYRIVGDQRRDYLHKLTTVIVRHYGHICLEHLETSTMGQTCKRKKVKRKRESDVTDVAMYTIRKMIEEKAESYGRKVTEVGQYYPSSKTCSNCGYLNAKVDQQTKAWTCPKCHTRHNRDYNAAVNMKKQIGVACPEFTPEDLKALRLDFKKNGVATSEVETGMG